jgi:hypothetical protein
MKFVKYLLIATTAILFIAACQKQLDFETDGLAHGTLKSDSTGDCLPTTINGIYKADTALNSTNFIDVQLDLNATGTYDIKSDTVNGYSFRGTGSIGITGISTVRLFGTGKPLVTGTDIFTIRLDNSTCKINVIVIGANTGPASFTISCSGATPLGNYIEGVALDINNTVTLSVDVVDTGTYVIAAASINGILFTATGVFTTLGVQSVTLNGTGVPLAAGNFNVTASNNNGTSTCTFSLVVLSAGSGSAVYTLDVTGGACSGATYSGTYTAGTPLTINNAVILNVNVTTLGNWSVSTNTNNGISFIGSGTFTATGPNMIVLTGSGTPTTGGVFNFTATAGTSTCTFSVTVSGTSLNADYLPETPFSNWSDRLVGGTSTDTSYWEASSSSVVKNGLTYRVFEIKSQGITVDTFYQRKNGGLYYHFIDDGYGAFDAPFNKEELLLDSSLAVNASWLNDLGSNTWNGLPATGLIECVITEKGATAVIAGNTYTDIIKVSYTFNYNIGSGNIVYGTEESWYAKGKGIVYDKYQDFPVTNTYERETTRVQVF